MNDTLVGLATAVKTHGSHSPNWSALSPGGEGGPQNQIQIIGCELQLPYPGFQKGKTSLTQPQTPFQARADESEPAKQAKESDCHLSLRQHLCASGPGILETCDPSPGDYWTTGGQWAGNRPPTAAPLDHLFPM